MTTKKLSKQAEDNLLSAVKGLCKEVDGGTSPTAAAIKTANDNKYGAEMIKLMCQGYNIGAVNHKREGGGPILDKLAELPLIDTDEVVRSCFPNKVATPAQEKTASVIDDCYRRPPRAPVNVATELHEKCAADLRFKKADVPVTSCVPVVDQLRGLSRGIKEARAAVAAARYDVLRNIGRLGDYFKQADAMPIEEFEAVAKAKYGASAEKLSDYIRIRNKQPAVKRASVKLPTTAVVWTKAPYDMLNPMFQSLENFKQASRDWERTTFDNHLKAAKLIEPIISISIKKTSISILPKPKKSDEEKHADALTNMLTWNAGRAGYDNLFPEADPAKEKSQVSDELLELSDPQHEDDLRAVRTQRMVHDLLKSDDVLSGYPPERVIDAYNELADFSPRIADKPVMVRSVLRKWLPQGSLDTFETSDLANAEKTLSETGTREPKVGHAKHVARSGVLSPR